MSELKDSADSVVLLPLDGSDLAEKALPSALDLARITARPLTLLMVLDSHSPDPFGDFGSTEGSIVGLADRVMDVHRGDSFGEFAATEKVPVVAAAEQYLRQAVERHGGADVNITAIVERGRHPAEMIVTYAEHNPVAMIVMSTHGRSGPGRWLLGSVTEKVVRSAPVPVLVVPNRES